MSLVQSEKSLSGLTRNEFGGALTSDRRWLLLLPLLMVTGLLLFSPNYREVAGERTAPLGGDFLQEWTAGQILRSSRADELYSIEHFREVQHDATLVGFEWPLASYFPPVYPPFYYLLMSPFSLLSYSAAIKVWAILSALFLIATGELLWRYYRPLQSCFGPVVLVTVIFVPLWVCFNLGQKSTLLLLILTGTFLLIRHGKPTLGGLVFGLMAFKPHLALVIGLAMLWKRQWKFVAGSLVTVTLLGLISLSCGWQVNLEFIRVTLGGGDYIATGGYQLADAHSLWGAVANLVGGSGWLANALTGLLGLAIVGLLVSILKGPFLGRSTELDGSVELARFDIQFAAMVLATVLLSPHLYFYDLVIVLLPLLLLGCNGAAFKTSPRVAAGLKVLIGMFALGAGLFINVAVGTRLQPSVIMLTVMLVLMAVAFRKTRQSVSPPHVAST